MSFNYHERSHHRRAKRSRSCRHRRTPLQPDYIKVKTVALAVNSTDFDRVAGVERIGGILGCELSGIMEEVGKECKSDVTRGDAVYGVSYGANLVRLCLAVNGD